MSRRTTSSRTLGYALIILACAGFLWPRSVAADPVNVFRAFTAHIQKQITADKHTFVAAQACTEWFYGQQRKQQHAPKAEGVAFIWGLPQPWLMTQPDCSLQYPGGLNAAREDFSRRQSSLALSLTFYQYALIGDRNDDERYTTAEIKDMLESFGLVYDATRAPAAYLKDLNATFDWIYKTGGLEGLMTSLGTLYEKGYRLTDRDRTALNNVTQ